jgi:hypothetical protein
MWSIPSALPPKNGRCISTLGAVVEKGTSRVGRLEKGEEGMTTGDEVMRFCTSGKVR